MMCYKLMHQNNPQTRISEESNMRTTNINNKSKCCQVGLSYAYITDTRHSVCPVPKVIMVTNLRDGPEQRLEFGR